jgi:hypothetical protein
MSAFAAALDNHTSMQLGENGNPEHTWTHKTDMSALVQLYFQLTRCSGPTQTSDERGRYKQLLQTAFGPKPQNSADDTYPPADREFARMLFKLIGHIRDIEAGKGERQIAYAFIWEYAQFNMALARYALYSLVHPLTSDGELGTGVQFGSWNDIKYFCNAIKEYSGSEDHPLIDYALVLMSEQIRADEASLHTATAAGEKAVCSLAVRWMPKENKRKRNVNTPGGNQTRYGAYTWQYFRLADMMFPYYKTAKSPDAYAASRRKARGELHRLYAPINKYLGTVQIAMSAGRKGEGVWDQISFGRGEDGSVGKYNVTGCTLRRHPNAWKNLSKDGSDRTEEGHRIQCATNYTDHMEAVSQGKATARGKTLNTYQLAKDAIGTSLSDETDVARINGQWLANSEGAPSTGMMLPMIDVSSSMEIDDSLPMLSAIGTGIRISEHAHPSLRNRALTFSANPSWFDLTSCGDNFVKKVHTVRYNSNWGGNTDLRAAFKLVLEALIAAKVTPDEAGQVVIVVLSDMQIDASTFEGAPSWGGGSGWDNTAQAAVTRMWTDVGYQVPHVVWWNLRKTTGFPVMTNMPNATMISGYSAAVLKSFEGKGIGVLKDYTPENMFIDLLGHERLACLDAKFDQAYPVM